MEPAEQGSDAWLQERCGIPTASNFDKVMAGKTTIGRQDYLWTLALERINGKPFETYKSKDMERGNELEPTARMRYMLKTKQVVEESPFVKHPTLEAGASPDGLVGEDGLVEFKAPKRHNHGHVLKRTKWTNDDGTPVASLQQIPSAYRWQVVGQQACTGRQWTDFASFSDEFPANAAFGIVRYNRDEDDIAALEAGIKAFNKELDELVEFITNYKGEPTWEAPKKADSQPHKPTKQSTEKTSIDSLAVVEAKPKLQTPRKKALAPTEN